MAINKRKVLDAARRYVQRGAKQKALKEYDRLLRLDPRDGKLRLELGDVHRRWGQIDEATAQYTKAALQYMQNGFDARAVAVFKQVLNLDPKRTSAQVSLAELYQRMGLASEALGSLQAAADSLHGEGKQREAVELLRKMAALDPSNTTSRMKVADLLAKEGMPDEAVAEYETLIAEFERQQSLESLPPVYERILEVQPERLEVMLALSRALLQVGLSERAESYAQRAIQTAPDDPGPQELICEIYKQLDREGELAEASHRLARLYRESGQEERARELMQRAPGVEVLDLGPGASETLPLAEALELDSDGNQATLLGDDDILSDDFLVIEDEPELASDPPEAASAPALSPDRVLPVRELDPEVAAETSAEPSLSEGDPDQLFAEASVYLRYGKRDMAIASLRGILAQEPRHRPALEKLGEAHVEAGDATAAVEAWARAAQVARDDGETTLCEILCDRIAALDPDAAAGLLPDVETAAVQGSTLLDPGETGPSELDLSGEVSFETGAGDVADLESANGLGIAFDEDSGILIDIEEPEIDPSPASEPALATAAGSTSAESTTASARIGEELEEAEFYLQQGLLDEAEAVYARILELAPQHPSALLRMGEIAAARGSDPDGSSDLPVGEVCRDTETDLEIEVIESIASRDPGDLDASFEVLDFDSASPVSEYVDEPTPQADPTQPLDFEIEAEVSLGDADGGFDLASELRNDLEQDLGGPATAQDGLRSIFSEFKQGVQKALEDDDVETRYDLGIAYREMSLFEDAIAEFRICLEHPERRLESLTMLGLCALDLGRPGDAVNHFEQALAGGELADEVRAAINFDLGRAHEAARDSARAMAAYRAVAEVDPDFKQVSQRIAALEAQPPGADAQLDAAAEPFESFDDLLNEVREVLEGSDDAGDSEDPDDSRQRRRRISFL